MASKAKSTRSSKSAKPAPKKTAAVVKTAHNEELPGWVMPVIIALAVICLGLFVYVAKDAYKVSHAVIDDVIENRR